MNNIKLHKIKKIIKKLSTNLNKNYDKLFYIYIYLLNKYYKIKQII